MWDNNKFPVRLILNGSASQEIDWHVRHYQGRGLMKRIEGVDALAKEMGISKDKLKSSFADMTAIAKGEKKDPFGKKFLCVSGSRGRADRRSHNNIFDKDDDVFAVAHMTPVLVRVPGC